MNEFTYDAEEETWVGYRQFAYLHWSDELDDEAFRTRIREHASLLDKLAIEIVARATQQCPTLDTTAVDALLRKMAEAQAVYERRYADWVGPGEPRRSSEDAAASWITMVFGAPHTAQPRSRR